MFSENSNDVGNCRRSWYVASKNCGKIGDVSPFPSRPCPPRAAKRWPKEHQSFDTSTCRNYKK